MHSGHEGKQSKGHLRPQVHSSDAAFKFPTASGPHLSHEDHAPNKGGTAQRPGNGRKAWIVD